VSEGQWLSFEHFTAAADAANAATVKAAESVARTMSCVVFAVEMLCIQAKGWVQLSE
jgi:hypothetical protein